MRTFDYSRPATVDEALALLREDEESGGSDGCRPLAGGTDLLTLMKADLAAPRRLVDLKRLADLPAGIEPAGDGGLTLGALTPLTEIERSPLVGERFPLLAEAAAVAATPQLRNMATVGGNLLQRPRCWYFRNALFHCWLKGGDDCPARDGENALHALFGDSPCVAVHPSDLAPALLAAGARIRLRGPEGERTVPLAGFYALPRDERRVETVARPDELLLSVHVPPLPAGARSTYLKAMDRKIWAFALVGVAVVVRAGADGRIDHARLVLGGVAPVPWRCPEAEQALTDGPAGQERIDRATEAALAGAGPLAHNGYKVPLARNLLRRALEELTAVPA